jgi:hypothetical protein
MTWQAQILNPTLKRNVPRLLSNIRILRDGKVLSESPPAPLEIAGLLPNNQKGVLTAGSVTLGARMDPGDYVLQLVVRDENDGSKLVSQSIDFQVVE